MLGALVISAVYYAGLAVRSDFTEDVFERSHQNESQAKGIIGLILGAKVPSTPSCPENEIRTCASRCVEECRFHRDCNKHDCKTDCYCRPGYARLYGRCEPRDMCPPPPRHHCPRHSVWGKKDPCHHKCDRQTCSVEEKEGCYCKEGYAFIANKCYPKRFCACGGNQTFSTNYDTCQELCTVQVAASCGYNDKYGCFCTPGYVRVNATNCVLPIDLPCPM